MAASYPDTPGVVQNFDTYYTSLGNFSYNEFSLQYVRFLSAIFS